MYLRKVLKRLIACDNYRKIVFISVIDDKKQLFWQPFCDLLDAYVINDEQFDLLHVLKQFRVISCRIKTVPDTVRDIWHIHEKNFCWMLFNQFIADRCCAVCLSWSDISPKIESPTFFFVCCEFVHIRATEFFEFRNVGKVFDSFASKLVSDIWLFKKNVDSFLFELSKLFLLFGLFLPYPKCRISLHATAESFCDSIGLNDNFSVQSSCVVAMTTLRDLRVSLCWLFLVDHLRNF